MRECPDVPSTLTMMVWVPEFPHEAVYTIDRAMAEARYRLTVALRTPSR
jgi:hypothetical protein